MEDNKPDNPSSDYKVMAPYWKKVTTILGGAEAMRRAKEEYLPKFEVESDPDYERRVSQARFTNVFKDIVENLAARPFGSEVVLSDESDPQLVEFSNDVDARGNDLHSFVGDTFFRGISAGIDWIYVDYSKRPDGVKTRTQEKAAGLRPFWCHYPAESVLAAYSDFVNGSEQFVHVRLREHKVERDGFGEKETPCIRVIEREPMLDGSYGKPTVTLYKKVKDAKSGKEEWIVEDGFPVQLTIDVIPLVPYITGRRQGSTWVIDPPMRDAAELQIELYQQENGLKNVKTYTAFPMLSGDGISPEIDKDGKPKPLAIGPRTVLYGGAAGDGVSPGSWKFVEPGAQSLKFLSEDVKDTISELRELGRQPLTAQSGNLTVITTAFAAEKGNSAIQAWAINLKDAIEKACYFTGLWLGIKDAKAEAVVNTDFDIGIGDDKSFSEVVGMYKEKVISREQLIHEAKRRGVIDKDYDPDDDLELILASMEDVEEDEPPTDEPSDEGEPGNGSDDPQLDADA